MLRSTALLFLIFLASCIPELSGKEESEHSISRVVSLDFCADQYVLSLVDKNNILALSPYASDRISYFRDRANGIPVVRPTAEDVLALKPDIVVRSYGGGPNIANFLRRSGIKVIQIGWISSLDGVADGSVTGESLKVATQLGNESLGAQIIKDYSEDLIELGRLRKSKSALYLTPSGYTTGEGTLIDEMVKIAGYENFEWRKGWRTLPLERLAYDSPDIVITSFFDFVDLNSENWSSVRHPMVKNMIGAGPIVDIDSASVSCGGWWIMDAIKKIAGSS